MKLILVSALDQAALNIAARLMELHDFERYRDLPDAYICGNVLLMRIGHEAMGITAPPLEADELIVASRHASETGRPSLTVHVPGDLRRGNLAMASPPTIKTALRELNAARDELGLPHQVSLEATHHGPTSLEIPVTFVEIGSKPEEWRDKKAGEAVARAIMAAANPRESCVNAVGFGGPHYAPRHTEVTLRSDIGVGHIIPKYQSFDEKLIERAVVRTRDGVKLFVLDWKGLTSEQRASCQQAASKLGIRVVNAGEIVK
jgi:D-aminoacyl-tRNA deacylase